LSPASWPAAARQGPPQNQSEARAGSALGQPTSNQKPKTGNNQKAEKWTKEETEQTFKTPYEDSKKLLRKRGADVTGRFFYTNIDGFYSSK